jgi:hypothetical protein
LWSINERLGGNAGVDLAEPNLSHLRDLALLERWRQEHGGTPAANDPFAGLTEDW